MKFIWNEPERASELSLSPRLFWQKPVIAWLNYNDVWPHTDRDHFGITYNYFHHIFEISIYECWLPGNGKPDRAIDQMIDFLSNSELKWSRCHKGETWRWDRDKDGSPVTRPGVKFTIKAEDFCD